MIYKLLLKTYLRFLRFLRGGLFRLGLLKHLDSWARRNRLAHYFRSLLALHDLEDMVALDTPWWTYKAIRFVDDFLRARPGAVILEFGSGASTVWLAKRASRVFSIEHEQNWHERLSQLLSKRQEGSRTTLLFQPALLEPGKNPVTSTRFPGRDFENYVKAAHSLDETFDVIVIDGRCRVECLAANLELLKPGGIIVFDNSERARYKEAFLNRALDLKVLSGLVPCSPFPGQTTICLRR